MGGSVLSTNKQDHTLLDSQKRGRGEGGEDQDKQPFVQSVIKRRDEREVYSYLFSRPF